ncbi:MAG: membrane protein insertase YidC [Alphaproteobacteria bacterium]
MSDQRNLIAAIAVSLAILFGFQFVGPKLFPQYFPDAEPAQTTTTGATGTDAGTPAPTPGVTPSPGTTAGAAPAGAVMIPGTPQDAERMRQAAVAGGRVTIESPRLIGSIALTGGHVDDLTLTDYKLTLKPDSPKIHLLSPVGSPAPYYATFGWSADGEGVAVPTPQTVWQASGDTLAPDRPVTLTWDNGAGLAFERRFALDRDYMITVTQTIKNNGTAALGLHAYGLVRRIDTPQTTGFYILHEGPIGVLNDALKEIDYDDLQDEGAITATTGKGWIGITDKYWLAALAPADEGFTATFRHWREANRDRYQVDVLHGVGQVQPGAAASVTTRLFAGAKEVQLLDRYEETFGIPLFDRAVDFGWFYFLTKPFFYVLDFFYNLIGNFGLAIMLLTVCVKLIFFPLANKSYKAMSKMKALQPEMVKLRERFGEDRQKLNQEMMGLYKKEKVNPAAGCLPILIQIPVFFALYKVLFVSIEMRHAPFYGWIKDLSAPDPTTVWNLFGLIPFDAAAYLPDFLMIGVWPILMGVSMFLQQKLNPAPADPVQAKVFMFMPIFFTFLLGTFAAGLVIYWTWNNLLSIAQQYVIMRRMGVPTGLSLKRSS